MSNDPAGSRLSLNWMLVLLLWLFVAAFLVPGLGDYGEGLWPEWFLFDQQGTVEFGDLVAAVRVWSIGALVTVVAIAVLCVWWVSRAWRARLRTYDVRQVQNYRMFVGKRAGAAFLAGCAVAAVAVLLSEALRMAEPVSWLLFGTLAGAFGALQFFLFVLAVPSTFRLFRGR